MGAGQGRGRLMPLEGSQPTCDCGFEAESTVKLDLGVSDRQVVVPHRFFNYPLPRLAQVLQLLDSLQETLRDEALIFWY